MQANLACIIKGVGGLSHSEWRTFNHGRKASDASGFIDGDFIEGYLELSTDQKLRVVEGLDVTVDHLTSTILELRRLHS